MRKHRVRPPTVFDPSPNVFSNAVRFGNLVFTTAKSGAASNGRLARGIAAQTRQSLENLRSLLEAAGTDMEHVLKTTVYLTSVQGVDAMNEVYASFFKVPPARAIVVVNGWADRRRLIEIDAVAGIP
jgi:2-iminobutanoate/2-iminopropanoate deaminase